MNDVKEELEYFMKKIGTKHPNKITNLIYDYWNLKEGERKLEDVLQWIEKILEELFLDKKIRDVYIRLHRFHNWYVIRLGGYGSITLDIEQSLYQISGEKMLFVSNIDKDIFVIKAACVK